MRAVSDVEERNKSEKTQVLRDDQMIRLGNAAERVNDLMSS
jgi:hypothetical protein